MTFHKPLILFVCAGNTCRSPMAEAILQASLPGDTLWRTASAGLAASTGISMSLEARHALAEIGCSAFSDAHRSQPLTSDLIQKASLIIVMTRAQADRLRSRFPEADNKLHLLRSFDPFPHNHQDICDPFCGSGATYRVCRDLIRAAMPGLIRFLPTLKSTYTKE